MAATISITSVAQLLSAQAPGSQGDVHVAYTFASPDGVYNVHLEFKTTSGNWTSAWDVTSSTGHYGADITSSTSTFNCYFRDPGQYGNVENVNIVNFRIKAFKS